MGFRSMVSMAGVDPHRLKRIPCTLDYTRLECCELLYKVEMRSNRIKINPLDTPGLVSLINCGTEDPT